MWSKYFLKAPPALMVLAVLLFLGMLLSRETSKVEDLPVFLSSERSFIYVELSGDGVVSGVHQFYDDATLLDVIKLTGAFQTEVSAVGLARTQQLQTGDSLKVVKKGHKIRILHRGWMPASHRIAMAIPLHPDRMSRSDWMSLPGIGNALAERIEIDRQNNGDYVDLEGLVRVKGIGEKKIARWREFFGDV